MSANTFTLILDPIAKTATIDGIPIDLVVGLTEILSNLTARVEALEREKHTHAPSEPNGATLLKIPGVPFGTDGFFGDALRFGFGAAFDGDITTFFDCTTSDGAICGLEFDRTRTITKIRYYPRDINNEQSSLTRMIGGRFEVELPSGSRVLVHTIGTDVLPNWNEVSIAAVECSKAWYVSPEQGYGNVSEIEFYGF